MKGVFYFTMFSNNITFYCTHVLIGDVYITSLKVRLLVILRVMKDQTEVSHKRLFALQIPAPWLLVYCSKR